jgi:hypothetical protein
MWTILLWVLKWFVLVFVLGFGLANHVHCNFESWRRRFLELVKLLSVIILLSALLYRFPILLEPGEILQKLARFMMAVMWYYVVGMIEMFVICALWLGVFYYFMDRKGRDRGC